MSEKNLCWIIGNLDYAQFVYSLLQRMKNKGVNSFQITHSLHAYNFLKSKNQDVLYMNPLKPGEHSYSLAEMEEKYGAPNLRHLIFPDQKLRELSDEKATDLICRILLDIENFIKNKRINAVLLKPMSAAIENCADAVARANGIYALIQDMGPIGSRTFVYSDMSKQNIWSELVDKVDELKKRKLTNEEREIVEKYIHDFNIKKQMRVLLTLPKIRLDMFPRFFRRLFESYDSPYNTLWHFIKRDGIKLLRTFWSGVIRLYDQPDFNEKYVFFPLHFAEDAQIVTRCPFYYNQAEMLRLIAMSVPAGYKVYTKEHPDERGINPIKTIKKMKSIKNVRVLAPTANSHEIIRKSEAVVVISSSVGWEAFLYRKPVMNLAPIYYGLSDLVYKVGDIRELPIVIKKALAERKMIYAKYTNEEWEKFIYAILSTVNKGNPVEFWNNKAEQVSEETINGIVEATLRKISGIK